VDTRQITQQEPQQRRSLGKKGINTNTLEFTGFRYWPKPVERVCLRDYSSLQITTIITTTTCA